MGRTKNYLRFVHESTFGLVAASQVGSSIKYLHMRKTKERFVAVPANENVYIWDLKTRQIINRLEYIADNASEITVFECHHGGHPRSNLIAVGYANGHTRVFEYETGMLKATFTGHRTAISAIAFDKSGSRLASGGKDCTIVLWDLVGERGLFSLKGHKNSISKITFLYNEEQQKDLLISSSLDAVSTIKFWDLQLQHCFYTLPGQASGVWSFVICKNGTRLITGSSSPELKVYSMKFLSTKEKSDLRIMAVGSEDIQDYQSSGVDFGLDVQYLGNILRNSSAISNRVQDMIVDDEESLIICYSVDKNMEFYGVRSDDDALTHAKKQTKKALRKQAKRKRNTEENQDQEDPDDEISEITTDERTKQVNSLDDLDSQRLIECEFNRKLGFEKLSDKIKSADVIKVTGKDGLARYKLAVVSSTNKIECLMYDPSKETKDGRLESLVCIESPSHRSDARSVSISLDNSLVLSASAESAKIWRLDTRSCIATIDIEYATCCAFVNAQHITATNFKNRFAVIGTKNGQIQIIDIADAKVSQTIDVCNDHKSVTSIFMLPDKTGLACGGEDGIVRFYNYTWLNIGDEDGQKSTTLGLEPGRTLEFQEGITCINISANNNLLAVALLDSTVRIHFVDTFKYFLTMYGHKFPVTTMDMSDDNTLLVTGSPDKNIKIWGLDFGDCHRSIFAHEDAITCVRFVPKTHYVFSSGRDRQIKQWDCDHFIKIQTLRKHLAEIWSLAVSPNGKYVITSSHDKSLRLHRKTEEILVPNEEDEAERELEDERNVFEKQENIVFGDTNLETGFAVKMTIDTVKSTDRLIEAIDVFLAEQEKEAQYKRQCEIAESRGEKKPVEPEKDPLLMTAMTNDYNRFMLETMRRIKSSELEEILITLPFDYVRKLLIIIVDFLETGWDIELMVRCATFLVKINFGQVASSPALLEVIHRLKKVIMDKTCSIRDFTGFNLMALEHMSQHRKYQSSGIVRT